jgi:hypothetical protein
MDDQVIHLRSEEARGRGAPLPPFIVSASSFSVISALR